MQVSTLIQYLFGNRRAIVDIANCRHAVWLGMLMVLSAGFAREYDGEDLLHDPWHLLLPLGASLLTSFLLFLLLQIVFSTDDQKGVEKDSFLAKYRQFLGLYWMTAPLAWLYAIPVERFLDAADAVRANLWLLGIVSVWRVALMTRVASVMYEQSAAATFFVVMLFADSVAMVIFWLTPLPIVSIMGGISLTESEQVIRSAGFLVRFLGTLTWLVWLIGAYVVAGRSRGNPADWNEDRAFKKEARTVTWGLWVLSAFSILVWIAILPFTQGEQINRRRVERDLQVGRIEEAIQYMSQRDRGDFPPHWVPPPHLGYAETQPPLADLLIHLERPGVAPWVLELFREKLAIQSQAAPWDFYSHAIKLREMGDEQLATYVRHLESLPEGVAMAIYHEPEIRTYLESQSDDEPELTDNRRASLKAMLSLIPEGQSRYDR